MSSQKRDRDENTPTNVEGFGSAFWPFKRIKSSEVSSKAAAEELVAWQPVLPKKGTNTEATAKPIPVEAKCSSSFSVWQAANPIRYNARLVAPIPEHEEEKGQFTAHVAPVDMAEHSHHFAAAFNSSQTFLRDADNIQCLPVNIETTQACLHNIVGALYSRNIALTPTTVEVTLRTAKFLGMPSIVLACTTFITKHIAKTSPLEVARLGKELQLSELINTAETSIIMNHWAGQNLQRLIRLLHGRSPKEIRSMLHRASRATMSELEVVEVLRAMSEKPQNLVQAIDFSRLHPLELDALGRHITSLPSRQHGTPFWSDVARQVLHCLLHPHNSQRNSNVVLWEVEADLIRGPQPESSGSSGATELFSPQAHVGGQKYHMVLKLGKDAGLFAKPEPGRALIEDGIKPSITLYVLPQVFGRTLCSASAFLGDMPDKVEESKGLGVGLSMLKTCILSSMADVVFVNSDGKDCVVFGMHVHHASH